MANLLVTGGAGFIGTNFVHYWSGKHPDDRLIVLDSLTYAGNRSGIEPLERKSSFRFVHGDIRNQELITSLLLEEGIETIVHFAAESHVDRSITGPAEFIETNILGTHRLLQAARDVWLEQKIAPDTHRFHHVSTDEVYGSLGPSDPAFTETTPYAPSSPYSASKAGSDHLVRAYHRTYGLRVTTSNCSNNYGPYQFPEKLIPLTIVNALDGKPLPVYGDGSNIRDWLYVDDHVRAIELVIRGGTVGETYNFGGNEEWANIDIVREICSRIDQLFAQDAGLAMRFPAAPAARGVRTNSLIKKVKDRPGHDWRYAIDTGKVEKELGFRPQNDFSGGLQQTISWMLSNEKWWRSVMDGSYRAWTKSHYPDS